MSSRLLPVLSSAASLLLAAGALAQPTSTNLGAPTNPTTQSRTDAIAAGGVRWYRVQLPSISGDTYLDIDSLGTALTGGQTGNDTEIALFSASGDLLAANDDIDPARQVRTSYLSFGRGSGRVYTPNVVSNGQSGSLAAGEYYIALAPWDVEWSAPFGANPLSPASGSVQLNFELGTFVRPAPPQAADLGVINATRNGLIVDNAAIPAAGFAWFTFQTPVAAEERGDGPDIYFDLHTFGSAIDWAEPSFLALFNADGRLVGFDSVQFNPVASVLSFGEANFRRAPESEEITFAGEMGVLPAGRYYLAVGGGPVTLARNFGVTPAFPIPGTIDLRFSNNMCPADVDNGGGTGIPDGGVGIEDLLYFLTVYESGTAAADIDDGSGTGTRDGGVGIEDLLYYLLRFGLGC